MMNQTKDKVHTDIFEADAAKVTTPTLSSIMTTVKTEAINQLGLQDVVDDVSKDVKTRYRKSVVKRAVLPSFVCSTPFPGISEVVDSKHSFGGSPILSNSLDRPDFLKITHTQESHGESFHKNIHKSIESQNILSENHPPPLDKFHPDDPSDMDIEEPSSYVIHGRETQEPSHFNDGRRLTSNFNLANNSKENPPEVRSDTNSCTSKNRTNAKSILNEKSFANKEQTFTKQHKRFKKVIDSGSISESENRLPEKQEREVVNSKGHRIRRVPEDRSNSSTSSTNSTFRNDLEGGRHLRNLKSSTVGHTYMDRRSGLLVEKKGRSNYFEAFPIEKFRESKSRGLKLVPRESLRYEIIDYNSQNKFKKKHNDHYQCVDIISDDSDLSHDVSIRSTRSTRNIYKSPKRRYLLRVRSSSEGEELQHIPYRYKALPLNSEQTDYRLKKRNQSRSRSPHQDLVEEGRKNRIRYIYNPKIRGRRREKEQNKYRLISNYADTEEDYRITNQNELISNHHDKGKTHKKTHVIHRNTDKQDCDMLDERNKRRQKNNKIQNMIPSFSEDSDISRETDATEAESSLLDAIFGVISDQKKKRKEYHISSELFEERAGKPLETQGESQQQSAQHSKVKKIEHVLNKLSQNYNNIDEDMNIAAQSPPNYTNSQQHFQGERLGKPIFNQLENHTDNIIILQNVTVQKKKESIIADETQHEINVELVSNNITNEVDTVKKDVFAKPIRPPRRIKSKLPTAKWNIEDGYADELQTDSRIHQKRDFSNIKKLNSNPEPTDNFTELRRSDRKKKEALPFWLKADNLSAKNESKISSKNLHPMKGKEKSLKRPSRAKRKKQQNMCDTATNMTGPVTTSNNKGGKRKQSVVSQKNSIEMLGADKSLESSEFGSSKTTEDEKKSTSSCYEGEGITSMKSAPIDHINKQETIINNKKTRKKRRPLTSPYKRKNNSVVSSKSKHNTKGSSIASVEIEQTRESSRRMDAHEACEADVQIPFQIDHVDAGDFGFADDNHKERLEVLPNEKATSGRESRSIESSDSPEIKNNKPSTLRDQAHDDKRNSPECLETLAEKFNDLLNEHKGSCSFSNNSGFSFLSLAPAEFQHVFNSEYAQTYIRLQGTNSLKIGAFQIKKSPDVFVVPKGTTAEIENNGSQHVVFFIYYSR